MALVIIFTLCALVVVYAYIGYPLLLALAARWGKKPRIPEEMKEEALPTVTMLVAAYNEEQVIAGKIENSLALDYPPDKLTVCIVSDGSTDRTDEIVRGYAGKGIRLARVEGRGGKTIARNKAVKTAAGEILVFSDANSMFRPDALRMLIRHFGDPDIGAVCGNLNLVGKEGRENLYWRYEKWIKRMEDHFHSIIGANGSIYALRRPLYRDLPPEVDDDFIEPLLAYQDGYRLRYEPAAVSIEEDIPREDMRSEFQAKKRVVLRGIQSIFHVPRLLNPFRYPVMAFELYSHKFCKWSVPYMLIVIFIINFFLPRTPFFVFTFLAQLAFYLSAFLGLFSSRKFFHIPCYFVSTNVAVFAAASDFLAGRRSKTWDSMRVDGGNP